MRKIIFILVCTLLSAYQPIALAASSSDLLKEDLQIVLPAYEDIQKLNLNKQELYWLALQDLVLKVSESEFNEGVTFADYKPSWWMNEAYAAAGDQCAYAGYILKRSAGNKCPTSSLPKCESNPNQIVCNPIVYGPDVCVAPGNKATSSCTKSARSPEKVKEYRDKNPQAYAQLQTDFSSYCRKGQQASVCNMVMSRLGEAARVVGVSSPSPNSVRSVNKNPRPIASADSSGNGVVTHLNDAQYSKFTESDTAALRKNNGCMSELLIVGLRCPESKIESLIEPNEAYQIFCNGDKELLKNRKSDLLAKIKEYKACTQRQLASASSERSQRYIKERLKSQLSKIAAGEAAVKKCSAVIEAGRKIEPRDNVRAGSIDFNSEMVKVSFNGMGNTVDRFNVAAHLGVMSQYGFGARLCDYNIVPKNGSAAPSIAPAAAPSSR